MAKKTTAAPRFSEVVFRGKPKVVKAFLKGLLMGAGREGTVFFSFDEGIHHEGKAEKLKEMFGVRATDCHVVVDAETAAYLKKIARKVAEDSGLEITANRIIRSAAMAFEYHAYARRYNDQIVTRLQDLPAGLKLQGYRHEVKKNPAAKGVEAYSVAHEYESSGSGAVVGRIDALVAFRRQMADFPLFQPEDIILKLA